VAARFLGVVSPGNGSGQSAAAGERVARQEVNATLVANVASAYFQLRELDLELDITKSAVASRTESLQFDADSRGARNQFDSGRAVRRSSWFTTATSQIADQERRIEQQENLLSILIGNIRPPSRVASKLTEQPQPPWSRLGFRLRFSNDARTFVRPSSR